MPRSKDNQYLYDWLQDTDLSPDDEESVSVELSPETERPLCAAQVELAEFPTDPELLDKARSSRAHRSSPCALCHGIAASLGP